MEALSIILIFILPLICISFFFSNYIYKIFKGEKVFLTKFLIPIEERIYKLLGIKEKNEMSALEYLKAVLCISLISFIIVFVVLIFQGILPLNPQKLKGLSIDLAFNIAVSFVTNTNWQSYYSEDTLGYFSQMFALTVQNFISAGIGISILFALIRGIINKEKNKLGNLWKDLVRIILYILIPISIVVSVILVSNGVVQTFRQYETINTLQTGEQQLIPLRTSSKSNSYKTNWNKWWWIL